MSIHLRGGDGDGDLTEEANGQTAEKHGGRRRRGGGKPTSMHANDEVAVEMRGDVTTSCM